MDAAVSRLRRAGVTDVSGEVLHVTGHHEDAARALLALADRTAPVAIVIGRAAAHGGELGAASMTTLVSGAAPCDVVVVAAAARRPEPVPA